MASTFNQSITTLDESVTIFVAIYDWTLSKYIFLFLSFINILFITPFFYYIIWYERYGANHKRTLINQFAASTCYYAMAYNLVAQSMEIVLLLFGPMGFGFCHLHRIIKAGIVQQSVQIQTSIAVVKYLYIFNLKNPSSLHDGFWCIFINIAMIFINLISQFAYQFLPGRNPLNIHICAGYLDRALLSKSVKINYPTYCNSLLCFTIYIFVATRVFFHRQKNSVQQIQPIGQNRSFSLPPVLNQILNTSFANFVTVAIALVFTISAAVFPIVLNVSDPNKLNFSPYYQIYNAAIHGQTFFGMAAGASIYYLRKKTMRLTVFREIHDNFLIVKEKFSFKFRFIN
jgi:hypothetical protein